MTTVGICNIALGLVGAPRITTLGDSTAGARLCTDNWANVRDQALQERDWTFAMKRIRLSTPEATTPAFGFARAFKLPEEVLQVREVQGTDEWPIIWRQEGRTILTDDAAIYVRGLFRIEDPSTWSPAFVRAVAYLLAASIASGLTEDQGREAQLVKLYEHQLQKAATLDGMQAGSPERPNPQGKLKAWRY